MPGPPHPAKGGAAAETARSPGAAVDAARLVDGPEAWSAALAVTADALQRDPASLEVIHAHVAALTGSGRLAEAAAEGTALTRQVPDDAIGQGLLADALCGLGRYKEAEAATQWMLDMRPGEPAGLVRTAKLREIYGDRDGAHQMWSDALVRTSPDDRADRADALAALVRLEREMGRPADADATALQAVAEAPGAASVRIEVARLRLAEGRTEEGLEILRGLATAVSDPARQALLATALERAGRAQDAAAAWALFDRSLPVVTAAGNVSAATRLAAILRLADGADPEKAVTLARALAGTRRDVPTLDALAWALHRAGHRAEASAVMLEALASGTREPGVLARAAQLGALPAGAEPPPCPPADPACPALAPGSPLVHAVAPAGMTHRSAPRATNVPRAAHAARQEFP